MNDLQIVEPPNDAYQHFALCRCAFRLVNKLAASLMAAWCCGTRNIAILAVLDGRARDGSARPDFWPDIEV